MVRKAVCVDLDGVLADYGEGWQGVHHIGDPIPGAKEFLKKLSGFADVVIFTTRCNPGVNPGVGRELLVRAVREWLDRHKMPYTEIWSESGKPIASAYVDDRAVPLDPQELHGSPSPSSSFGDALVRARYLCGIEESV